MSYIIMINDKKQYKDYAKNDINLIINTNPEYKSRIQNYNLK